MGPRREFTLIVFLFLTVFYGGSSSFIAELLLFNKEIGALQKAAL